MATIELAIRRASEILAEIDRLKQSDFPYPHPYDALKLLEEKVARQKLVLQKINPDSGDLINDLCRTYLDKLYVYIPILGFILRSTDIRNAFEAYTPILRLAQSLLGSETKLIISSEWEYSPFVYKSMRDLPGFVLIGLPAPESSNPLLIPLAGHELGHAVWEAENFPTSLADKMLENVVQELTTTHWEAYKKVHSQYEKADLLKDRYDMDIFVRPTWDPAFSWALMQAEEIFCDFFGLRLFAESYLYAFEYLTSPGITGHRSVQYPNNKNRIGYLLEAAKSLGVNIPPGFGADFEAESEPDVPAMKLLLSVADAASAVVVPDLIKMVKDFATCKAVPARKSEEVSQICDEFRRKIAPIKSQRELTDILNAGWNCSLDQNLWKEVIQIKSEDRDRILKDLMLKSMEVTEVFLTVGNLNDS